LGQDGYWSTAAAGFPAWLQVDINGSKTISEVDAYVIQDDYSNPIEPTESTTFSLWFVGCFEDSQDDPPPCL
jgi:hypothetical protein